MTRPIGASIRASVQALHAQASLRELADVLGVSHQAVWKLLQGRSLRRSTLRRIADGLAGSREAVAFDQLLDALGTLLGPVRAAERRSIERKLGEAVEEAFRRARQPAPEWVGWLSEGRRSAPSAKKSVEALVRRAQAGSTGGLGALRRRPD